MPDQLMEFIDNYDLTIKIVFILVGTIILARVVNSIYRKLVSKSVEKDDSNLTTYKFVGNSISAIIYA